MTTNNSEKYQSIQKKLCQGWNMWNTNYLLSQLV